MIMGRTYSVAAPLSPKRAKLSGGTTFIHRGVKLFVGIQNGKDGFGVLN